MILIELFKAYRFKRACRKAERLHRANNRQYLVINISGRAIVTHRDSIRAMIKDLGLKVNYQHFLDRAIYKSRGYVCK